MKKHKLMAIAIATATACMSFVSCSDNNQDPAESNVEMSYTLPVSLDGATVSNTKVTFCDINTGHSQVFDMAGTTATVTIPDGLYDIELSGEIAYTVNGETVTSHLRAIQNTNTHIHIHTSSLRASTPSTWTEQRTWCQTRGLPTA